MVIQQEAIGTPDSTVGMERRRLTASRYQTGPKSRQVEGHLSKDSSSNVQKKLIVLTYQERERQREIDHHNKILLGQLLKIEKDMHKSKRIKPVKASHSKALSQNWASQAVTSTMSTTNKPEFHARKNKRNNLMLIDVENSRLYG